MKIIDISWPITEEMTAYKDKKVVKIVQTKKFEQDQSRESLITISSHSGTHVDAPAHFLQEGKRIDEIPLDQLVGKCKVLDFPEKEEKITEEDLKHHHMEEGDIILFKTKNSQRKADEVFDYNFVYLDSSGAEYLNSKKIKAVGIDYLGIERNQPQHETHEILLKNDIMIIEGLRLEHVKGGNYLLFCLPLAFVGLEASVARAVLIEEV